MCCSTQHLREQLEAAENEITEQGQELEERAAEVADLHKKLFDLISEREKYKKLVDELDVKYLNCREAAKRFIETHPECDTVG